MTTPGILSDPVELHPLPYLSPSRYVSFQQCALRGVLAGCGAPALLPLAPAARLGTAIHRLLEEAGAGQLANGTAATLSSRWHELVSAVEREMQDSWLECHLVPLRTSVKDFEVRRVRALELAARIARVASPHPGMTADHPETGEEVWVQSKSGLIRGRIDAVRRTGQGIVIKDYKTGSVYEQENEGHALKKEYEVQLKIYAALYAETFDEWPARVEIVPLGGEVLNISVAPAECRQLLEHAESTLHRLNQMICTRVSGGTESALAEALARPGLPACVWCEYRPICPAYQRARATSQGVEWPADLFGVLQEIRRLGNGKIMLTISDDLRCHRATVRALSTDPLRHPGLQGARAGERLSLFNLRPDKTPCCFSEAPATTIYQL